MNYVFPNQQTGQSPLRRANGVVCFGGEDWWYHNRGHYDMRVMQELAAFAPVLYVNSIGMRVPTAREGRMFLRRIRRKLQSIGRGYTKIDHAFCVTSAPIVPGRLGMALTQSLASKRIRRASQRQLISRPLVWVACPTAANIIDSLDPIAVVYQRTDRYEEFKGVDIDQIKRCDAWLKARADLTVFCSSFLYEQESAGCRRAIFVDHGVDAERFGGEDHAPCDDPADIADLPRPRVGFVGGIDSQTFDPDLFCSVVEQLQDIQFVVVGGCSLPDDWCTASNVRFVGQKPIEDVSVYMRSCDVLIMPWKQSRWIEACNPVKLKEYLASGRPIVTTPFPELERYKGLVHVAHDSESFARKIQSALKSCGDTQARKARVRDDSWRSKAEAIVGTMLKERIVLGNAGASQSPEVEPKPTECIHDQLMDSVINDVNGPGEDVPDKRTPDVLPFHDAEPKISSSSHVVGTHQARQIDSCVILGGSLRPSDIVRAAGCSVLDLWLSADRTVLETWLERISACSRWIAPDTIIKVDHDRISPAPSAPLHTCDLQVSIQCQRSEYRGPAGVLADACEGLGTDTHILVLEGARYASVELDDLFETHFQRGDDVTIARNSDHTPAGVYVIRAETLRLVPELGFTDLKEQWIPQIMASGYTVGVYTMTGPGVMPLRTREQFLDAAMHANSRFESCTSQAHNLDVQVICRGASVDRDATVFNSIIMPGAHVGAGAVIARSLVCSDSEVHSGERITHDIVKAGQNITGCCAARVLSQTRVMDKPHRPEGGLK